jgi:hypothetical protein
VHGVDRHPWAVDEARETYRIFGLRGRTRVDDLTKALLPERSAVVAAFAVNELTAATRDHLLPRLLKHAERGGQVLVVEPNRWFIAPWWPTWQRVSSSEDADSGAHGCHFHRSSKNSIARRV